jgi:FkbM family methyltransferase
MNRFIYNLTSKLIKILTNGDIVGKDIYGLNKKLYYERSQHLTFLFKSKIKYEEIIQKKIRKYLNEGDLVFDIGGNIGQYAIPFSEIIGNKGKVVSFEPDYRNYSFLQFNTNINKCKNVICQNYGIGGGDSKMEFYRDSETGGRRGSYKKKYVGANFKGLSDIVYIKKFDTIISEFGIPNFVKIDVEGFEDEIIGGLSTDLKNCIFLIEVREETKSKVFKFFNQKKYECIWIDNIDKIIKNTEEIPGFANLIFKKK